jgi:hypothetical protein
MTIVFQRVKEGDRPSAVQFNLVLDELERVSEIIKGGNVSSISTSGGIFPFGKQPEIGRFLLTEDLNEGATATSDKISWDGQAFVKTGEKLLYGDYVIGSIKSGTKVVAFLVGGRYYPAHAGSNIKIGKTDAELLKDNTANVSIWDGNTSATITDTGENEIVFNRFADTIASGMWVAITRLSFGWEVIAAEC